MRLSIIVALFWSKLAISQLVVPQYSCQTCNVVNFFRKGDYFGLSSVCTPMSCDSSTTASVHGPSCISPRGESLVCNGTVSLGWNYHPVVCNCVGSVSLTGLNNISLPIPVGDFNIDPNDLLGYQPISCSTTSDTVPSTEEPCKFKDMAKIYSYYDATGGGSYTTRCLPLFYPSSDPQTPYYLDGTPLICDGSVHTSLTNQSYICKLGENLDADTVLSLYNSTDRRDSPTFLDCASIRGSHEVMLDYRQALDQVRRDGIDLGPIINIVPT
ncbi:hypothetical protein CPB86DRAFT_824980 [Serendipita vermifera]|nr:hypothetical protein CPB86DRAFT_824980 [Serendipita vermifera]